MREFKYTVAELAELIVEVRATAVGKKTAVDIILSTGETFNIKKSSTRKPVMVQLYDHWVNGNNSDLPARFFTFSKTIESYHREDHVKSFVVQ